MIEAVEDFLSAHREKLAKMFVLMFAFVWVTGLTAGLTAGACRKEQTEPDKRIIYCNISLIAGSWADLFPTEYRKRSVVQLHRGIAFLQADRLVEAERDFRAAIEVLLLYPNDRWLKQTHLPLIKGHPDVQVESLWLAILEEIISSSATKSSDDLSSEAKN